VVGQPAYMMHARHALWVVTAPRADAVARLARYSIQDHILTASDIPLSHFEKEHKSNVPIFLLNFMKLSQ
jgi:hypothetical protein